MSNPSAPRNDRWPAQIKYIVGNEACERFSFYGMKGILVGYMTTQLLRGGLNMSDDNVFDLGGPAIVAGRGWIAHAFEKNVPVE